LSRREVLLLAAPPFVVAVSLPAFEVDLALALCESSDFDLAFLPAALGDVDDASGAHACVKLPLIVVAAIDRSLVLPGKCANHPLSRVASGPSAPDPLGLRASVKSCCCPWPELEELEDGGGVDAEKCRSERAVPYALGGLLSTNVRRREVCSDSCSVGGIRCGSRSRSLYFPSPRKRVVVRRPEADEVEVEFEVLVV
jgi:hypothetical protein